MKRILFLAALVVALCTSPSFAQHQLLNRMLGRCGCAAPANTCCETPAPANNTCCQTFESDSSCGCGNARGLFPLFGHHGRGGNDCCEQADPCARQRCSLFSRCGHRDRGNDCCEAPVAAPAAPCCEQSDPCARQRCSLFSRCGHRDRGNDCCEQADPCDTGCGRGGLFGGHHAGRGRGNGCNDDCGCESARHCGLLDRARGGGHHRARGNNCCDPCQTSDCGCGGPAGTPAPATEPAPAVEPQPATPAPTTGAQTRILPMVDPNAFRSPTTRFTSSQSE